MKAEPHRARERLNQAQEQRRERYNKAQQGNGSANGDSVTLDDFFAFMPMHGGHPEHGWAQFGAQRQNVGGS
jgi:hypothetical protein